MFICSNCNQPAEKAHHRTICKACEIVKSRQHYQRQRSRIKGYTIDPEISIYALRFRLAQRLHEQNLLDSGEDSPGTLVRKALASEIESIKNRIIQLEAI